MFEFDLESVVKDAGISVEHGRRLMQLIHPETALTSAYPIVDGFAESGDLDALFSFATQLVKSLSSAVEVVRKAHVDADLACGYSRFVLVRSAAFLLNLVNVNMGPYAPQTLPVGLAEATRATCDDLFLSLSIVGMHQYVSKFYTAVASRYSDRLEPKGSTVAARRAMWGSVLQFIDAVDANITQHCLRRELASPVFALRCNLYSCLTIPAASKYCAEHQCGVYSCAGGTKDNDRVIELTEPMVESVCGQKPGIARSHADCKPSQRSNGISSPREVGQGLSSRLCGCDNPGRPRLHPT